jgi:hypothetical protein
MDIERYNTVKVQLPERNDKPLESEVMSFVIVSLGLKGVDIIGVAQNPGNDGIIYIKCCREEKMDEIITLHNGTFFRYDNGTVVRVTMSQTHENIRYVRVFGLPFEADDSIIAEFFGQFGEIRRQVKEKYAARYNFDALTGVRGLYIDLKKEIPSFLYIRNCRVKVHYHGMKEKCHICGSTEHMRNDCPRKVQPIITPISRMQNMTNLNDLFKRPVITMTSSNNKNDSATDQTNQNSGNNKTTNTATTSNTSTVTQVPVLSSASTKTPTQAKNGLLQQQVDQNESAEKYVV